VNRRRIAPALAGLSVLAAALGADAVVAAPGSTCGPKTTLAFEPPKYVDRTRAGGEPIVFTYPDGTLLYGSHAGTTHFYTPGAIDPDTGSFAENYEGQTYYWWSDTNGAEWKFVDRTVPPSNVPGTGFSDPEFAYDTAGNVYVSEINLVNVAVSKSTDAGRSYVLQNPTANIFTDRQWTEGDEENVVYMVSNPTGPGGSLDTSVDMYKVNSGHTMYKSKDGGKTWTAGFADPGGLGDIRVDKNNGTVYEMHLKGGSELHLAAFREARTQDFATPVEAEENLIADDVHMLAHWPAFDLDDSGNIYVTWDENGVGEREAGIWYSYSKDAGKTWATPTRVNTGENTAIWPWLGVGDDGKVGIAWFETDRVLSGHNAETPGTHPWRVVGATTITGHGCGAGRSPAFSRAVMTPDPIHTGTICQGGTTCQATATDRRLGDYFSVDITNDGMMYAGYSDTAQGGGISLPAFVKQNGGTPLIGSTKPVGQPAPPEKPNNPGTPTGPGGGTGGGGGDDLAATGLDLALPATAGLLALVVIGLRRRRRRAA
jgi:hypothetical protein